MSPKQSPPNAAAPPPPPPPPPLDGPQSPPSLYKSLLGNGDINNGGLIMPQKKMAKKVLPAIDDTRNDLLKAIRDGKS